MLAKFDPFSCDIGVLRYLRSLESRKGKMLGVGVFVFLPLIILVITTGLEGTLVATDYVDRLRAAPGAVIRRILGSQAATAASPADDSTYPLMGDFVVSAIYVLQILNICIVYRQWKVMESFFVDLHCNGVVKLDETALNGANLRIQKLNCFFSYVGAGLPRTYSLDSSDPSSNHGEAASERAPLADRFDFKRWSRLAVLGWPILMLVLAFWLARGIGAESAFAYLGAPPEPTDAGGVKAAAAQQAYASWWASTVHTGGRALLIAISACLLFYIVLQNVVGFGLAGFFICLFHSYKGHIELAADYRTHKEWLGWAPLRQLWNTITFSIICNFLSLAVIFSVYRAWRLAPLFGLFVASLLFLVVPPYLLDRNLRVFRENERQEAASLLDRGYRDAKVVGWRRAYHDEYELINRATVTRILGRTTSLSRLLAAIASIGGLLATLIR